MITLRRIPSNQMPPFRRTTRSIVVGWILTILFGAGLVYLFTVPLFLKCALVIGVVSIVMTIADNRRARQIKDTRPGESICSFARQIDCRENDTWIVRAVYDELSQYVLFPIRPNDDIKVVLRIDPEDFEDSVLIIAERTGRSLENYETNPFYGSLNTPHELVKFLMNQPKGKVCC